MYKFNQVIEVKGKGEFPVDMLRYDRCYPYTGEDSNNMAIRMDRSIITEDHEDVTIRLSRYVGGKKDEPTYKRWASFLWEARVIETRKVT